MIQKKRRWAKVWPLIILCGIIYLTGPAWYPELSAGNEETYKGLKIFSDVIELVERNYVDPVDSEELIHKAIQGMVHSLDPHSQLLPPEAFEELKIDTSGEFGGIGIVITMQKGLLTVISPIEGTPAYKAGVKAGDIIIKVDGEPTKDMMLWEAVKKMRGEKGTSVNITIMREEVANPLEFTLTRDIIPIESVKYLVLKDGYGYVRLTNFQENTTDDLAAALNDLETGQDPLKGIILDLRDNPGGLLNQAIRVSDLFLDEGVIVSIKGRLKKHTKDFKATRNMVKRDYPIVVLINGGSASASEIIAGALQDQKRAVILGTTSFGKGTVQTVETLRDGYGLKFTIARYYTPSGSSIQASGIKPDIVVRPGVVDTSKPSPEADMLKEKDLKNHLQAEPDIVGEDLLDEPDADDEEDGSGELERKTKSSRYGPLEIDSLLSDIQILRALDILVGYQIFAQKKAQ